MVAPVGSPARAGERRVGTDTGVSVTVGRRVDPSGSATRAVGAGKARVGVSAAACTGTVVVCGAEDASSPAVVLFAVSVSVKPSSLGASFTVSPLATFAAVIVKLAPL